MLEDAGALESEVALELAEPGGLTPNWLLLLALLPLLLLAWANVEELLLLPAGNFATPELAGAELDLVGRLLVPLVVLPGGTSVRGTARFTSTAFWSMQCGLFRASCKTLRTIIQRKPTHVKTKQKL